jgi:hypothetical protein
MEDIKEITQNYFCECCQYQAKRKYHFDKHLLTKKHARKMNGEESVSTEPKIKRTRKSKKNVSEMSTQTDSDIETFVSDITFSDSELSIENIEITKIEMSVQTDEVIVDNSELENKYIILEEECEYLKDNIELIKQEIYDANEEEKYELKNEIENLKNVIKELENENEKLNQKIDNLCNEDNGKIIEELKQDIKGYLCDIDEKDNEIYELKEQVRQMKNEILNKREQEKIQPNREEDNNIKIIVEETQPKLKNKKIQKICKIQVQEEPQQEKIEDEEYDISQELFADKEFKFEYENEYERENIDCEDEIKNTIDKEQINSIMDKDELIRQLEKDNEIMELKLKIKEMENKELENSRKNLKMSISSNMNIEHAQNSSPKNTRKTKKIQELNCNSNGIITREEIKNMCFEIKNNSFIQNYSTKDSFTHEIKQTKILKYIELGSYPSNSNDVYCNVFMTIYNNIPDERKPFTCCDKKRKYFAYYDENNKMWKRTDDNVKNENEFRNYLIYILSCINKALNKSLLNTKELPNKAFKEIYGKDKNFFFSNNNNVDDDDNKLIFTGKMKEKDKIKQVDSLYVIRDIQAELSMKFFCDVFDPDCKESFMTHLLNKF